MITRIPRLAATAEHRTTFTHGSGEIAVVPVARTERRAGERLSGDLRDVDRPRQSGYDGQPAVFLYIVALEVNVLNCRISRVGPSGRTRAEPL
jgi:hypothetical protein